MATIWMKFFSYEFDGGVVLNEAAVLLKDNVDEIINYIEDGDSGYSIFAKIEKFHDITDDTYKSYNGLEGLHVHVDIRDEFEMPDGERDTYIPFGHLLIIRHGFFHPGKIDPISEYPGCDKFEECSQEEWKEYHRTGDFASPFLAVQNLCYVIGEEYH